MGSSTGAQCTKCTFNILFCFSYDLDILKEETPTKTVNMVRINTNNNHDGNLSINSRAEISVTSTEKKLLS